MNEAEFSIHTPTENVLTLDPLNPLFQTQTLHAYAFARGDREEGLRGVCRNASIARNKPPTSSALVIAAR